MRLRSSCLVALACVGIVLVTAGCTAAPDKPVVTSPVGAQADRKIPTFSATYHDAQYAAGRQGSVTFQILDGAATVVASITTSAGIVGADGPAVLTPGTAEGRKLLCRLDFDTPYTVKATASTTDSTGTGTSAASAPVAFSFPTATFGAKQSYCGRFASGGASGLADPEVLLAQDGKYYAYGSNIVPSTWGDVTDAAVMVPVVVSNDLVTWQRPGDATSTLPTEALKTPTNTTYWADLAGGGTGSPTVRFSAPLNRYVMYYTALKRGTSIRCLGVATSASPIGPFDWSAFPNPVLCTGAGWLDQGITHLFADGVVDPSIFTDPSGSSYLLFSSVDGGHAGVTNVFIHPLTAALTSFASPGNAATTKLLTRDQAWEQPGIAQPAMIVAGGTRYLTYRGNRSDSVNSGIGLAVCPTVTGPCTKQNGGLPIFTGRGAAAGNASTRRTDHAVGVDAASFFADAAGHLMMAYGGWTDGLVVPTTAPAPNGDAAGVRALFLQRIRFTPEDNFVQQSGSSSVNAPGGGDLGGPAVNAATGGSVTFAVPKSYAPTANICVTINVNTGAGSFGYVGIGLQVSNAVTGVLAVDASEIAAPNSPVQFSYTVPAGTGGLATRVTPTNGQIVNWNAQSLPC